MSSNWNKDNNNFNEGATYGSQSQGKRNIGNKMSDNIQNLGQQGKESLNQVCLMSSMMMMKKMMMIDG